MISAQRMQGPESFIIEIEAGKVEGLLSEFEGDLSFLSTHLKLMNNRMVLLNPVSEIICTIPTTILTSVSFFT